MIIFKEITYSEYDAMRELYNELSRNSYGDNKKFEVINRTYLPGILRGNSVVVEKFTTVTKLIGRDRYRMYIRVGTKAKMPDEVRLPKSYRDTSIGTLSVNLKDANIGVSNIGPGFSSHEFSDKKKNNGGGGFKVSLDTTVTKLLGDAIFYSKKGRLLILELDSVSDAARALNVLPFGLGYKIYLLD